MTGELAGSLRWRTALLPRAQHLVVIIERHEAESELQSGSGQDSLNRRDAWLTLARLDTSNFRLGHPCSLGQLTLGETRLLASEQEKVAGCRG